MVDHGAPDPSAQSASNLPASTRHLTTSELETVIRRAVELQAGHSVRADEGVSEDDVVRIGQELGLDASAVRRAMAEVRSRPPQETGVLVGLAGTGTIRASRVLQQPAAATMAVLDRHLRESELMVPQRRFPERIRYVRDSSLAAGLSRFARSLSRAHKPLNLQQLDAAVSPLDAESCLVEVSVDLTGTRAGLVAGVLGSSSVLAAGWAGAVLATPLVDPLMLVSVPVVAGAWYGTRAIYRAISRSTEDKLESLLDRLEHNDLG